MHGNTVHGKRGTRAYKSWNMMKNRCLNPNARYYERYGGRGIKFCPAWAYFENFYRDMGDRPESTQLDRIDNEGDYSPSNCRWATRKENCRNTSRNHFLEWQGQRHSIDRRVGRDHID